MQTTSPVAGPSGKSQQTWSNPNAPPMYPQAPQQRNSSNPRQYIPHNNANEPPRDASQTYQDGYGYPQSQAYPQNYVYQGASMPFASSPSAPSGSRRTSGPKSIATPPAVAPAHQSPGSRYYPTDGNSPYLPASAPPQAVTHQIPTYPQTAHPYGGGYHNYYEQSHAGGWANQYHPSRPGQSPSSTTPTIPQSSTVQTPHSAHTRTPATGSSYDYPPSAGSTSYWGQDPNRSQAWSAPRPEWQAQTYQNPPYAWQQQVQQYPQYGYPPQPQAPPPHLATSHPVAAARKEKKVKKEEDYGGLGKRPMELSLAEDVEGKKKKGKKEEPPVVIVAKSHLKQPRQAQSAWQLFFTDELNKAKAAVAAETSPGGTTHNAKLNVAQIAKDAGLAYANLNDEQKAHYAEKVQESKDQHAKEMAEWQATLTPEDIRLENAFRAQQRKEGKSRKGNLKDPNAPKKPLSAYFLFLKGIREDAGLRFKVWADETETTKQSVLAAERWRNLSDEEKKPFLSQAEVDKAEYETLRKAYEDDAAARARGEEVPLRVVEPVVRSEPPKPIIKDLPVKVEGYDGFEGLNEYHDPLEGIDLAFEGEGEWNIEALMETEAAGEVGQGSEEVRAEAGEIGLPLLDTSVVNETSDLNDQEYTSDLATPVHPTPLSSSVPVTPHDHANVMVSSGEPVELDANAHGMVARVPEPEIAEDKPADAEGMPLNNGLISAL